MNNNHVFPTLTLHLVITLSFFLIVVPVSHCQNDDHQFSNCTIPYPYRCGSSELNISYPFWGGNRPRYCGHGHEGLEIKCQDSEYHFIEFSNQKFRVITLSMNESHPTMTIARDDLRNNSCPGNETQDTVMLGLEPYLFKYSPNVVILSLFYCQDIPPQHPDYFNCSLDGEDSTGFYTVFIPGHPPPPNLPATCQELESKVAVLWTALKDLNRTGNLSKALNKGFEVEYSLDITKCSACNSSGGICGSDPLNPRQHQMSTCPTPTPTPISSPPVKHEANVKLKLGIGFAAAFTGMAVMGIFSFWYYRRYNNKNAPSPYTSRNISSDRSSMADLEKTDKLLGVQVFSYTELEEATNHFDSAKELGDGGFGTVYYGKLQDGRAVAVKRLYENNYKRVEQFMNEVEILAHLRHTNLVTLYGCTSRHSRELLLVYEYISNGTVADHLHGELSKPGALPWATRLNIAVETACALKYLHASDIIHRDVKTNNILLDNNFSVKVADFGLSRLFPNHVSHVSTAPQGTPGYVDPEYHQCYQLTDKSDVFSFGVVLVELISSMPAVDITRHRHEINLSNLAINKIQNKALHELVDPSLGFESDYKVRKMIYSVAELAFQCLQSDKDLRPSMTAVLDTLKDIRSDGYSKEKAEELDITDDVGLLKHGPPTPSPDSGTSWKTTPPSSN